MNVEIEEIGNSQVKLTITVDEERVEAAKKKAARSLSREITIPGFRPGKAPYAMIKQFVGEQNLLQQAVEEMGPDIISEAIEEADVEVWSYEHVEPSLESLEPLTFEVLVPTAPRVELGDVDEIDVEREDVEVDDEDVEETLEALRERQATWIPAAGPAEYGDRVTIDLHGERLDGEVVLDVEGEELQLRRLFDEEEDEDAGSEIVLPGQDVDDEAEHRPDLMAELRGMTVNQTKQFSLRYPEDWENERMAGRTIMYTATLLDLKKQMLPELDAEFAQTVGDFEDVDELRDHLRENIRAEAEEEQENRFVMDILDALVERSTISYPQTMEDEWVERRVDETSSRFHMYGLTLDQYLEMNDQSYEDYEAEIRESVQQDIQRGLVLSEYGRAHDISVTGEELQREIGLLRANIGRQGIDESVLDDEEVRQEVAERLATRKILNRLRADVTGEPERPLFPVEEEDVRSDDDLERELAIEISAEDIGADQDAETEESAEAPVGRAEEYEDDE